MLIGDRIRELRLARNWSQEKLAIESGISYGTVRMIESSRTPSPGIQTLVAIARALEVNLLDIIEGAEDGPQ